MSQPHTRKSFFGKLVGLIAAVGIAPKLFSKVIPSAEAAPASTPFSLRPDARAIARRDDTV